jgi:hypothetical protein
MEKKWLSNFKADRKDFKEHLINFQVWKTIFKPTNKNQHIR